MAVRSWGTAHRNFQEGYTILLFVFFPRLINLYTCCSYVLLDFFILNLFILKCLLHIWGDWRPRSLVGWKGIKVNTGEGKDSPWPPVPRGCGGWDVAPSLLLHHFSTRRHRQPEFASVMYVKNVLRLLLEESWLFWDNVGFIVPTTKYHFPDYLRVSVSPQQMLSGSSDLQHVQPAPLSYETLQLFCWIRETSFSVHPYVFSGLVEG